MSAYEEIDDEITENEPRLEPDALTLLRADHDEVQRLFDSFDAGVDSLEPDRKQAIAERLCTLLLVHAQIEEEVFYPSARDVIDAEPLLDEAEVEHAVARELIEQIQSMDPEDAFYDAKVKVLGTYVALHVRAEEDQVFPQVEMSEMDLAEIGAQLRERRDELLQEYGMELSR